MKRIVFFLAFLLIGVCAGAQLAGSRTYSCTGAPVSYWGDLTLTGTLISPYARIGVIKTSGIYSHALTGPTIQSVTAIGTTGATTYSYKAVATNALFYNGPASAVAGSVANGNATLSGTNYNDILIAAVEGAVTYSVYRTVGGATQGLIGTVSAVTDTSVHFYDTGLAGDGSPEPTTSTYTPLFYTSSGVAADKLITITTPDYNPIFELGNTGGITIGDYLGGAHTFGIGPGNVADGVFKLSYDAGAGAVTFWGYDAGLSDGGLSGAAFSEVPIYFAWNSNPVFVFEGTGANDGFETTVTVTNPTADRNITWPDASGTLALLEQLNTFTEAQTISKDGNNAAAQLLDLVNSNVPTSGNVSDTAGLSFSFVSSASVEFEAARIEAYKIDDWEGIAFNNDSGLKFYTTVNGTSTAVLGMSLTGATSAPDIWGPSTSYKGLNIRANNPALTNDSTNGAPLKLYGGPTSAEGAIGGETAIFGGDSTNTDGEGGVVSIYGGDATNTNGIGGYVLIGGGAGGSGGANGGVNIGTTDTNSIMLGATGITTTVSGPLVASDTVTVTNDVTAKAFTIPMVADAVMQYGSVVQSDAGTDDRFDVCTHGTMAAIGVLGGTGPSAQGTSYDIAFAGKVHMLPTEDMPIVRGTVCELSVTPGRVLMSAGAMSGEDVGRALYSENVTATINPAGCGGSGCINTALDTPSAGPAGQITLGVDVAALGWTVDDPVVYYDSGGVAPTGLTSGNVYWLKSVSTTKVTIAATKGGAVVVPSSQGDDATQYLQRLPKCQVNILY